MVYSYPVLQVGTEKYQSQQCRLRWIQLLKHKEQIKHLFI